MLGFVFGNTLLLGAAFLSLILLSGSRQTHGSTPIFKVPVSLDNNYSSYSAVPDVLGAFTQSQIKANDARPALVDNFLAKYHSPFQGLGQFIVDSADKYRISYGLVPAIAQCESNVGKVVPHDSFNAWGYGIYGQKVLRFNNWFEAIERVSRGLREDYYDKGLDTPEKIMKKYTPPSNGSWAECVNSYLEELQ